MVDPKTVYEYYIEHSSTPYEVSVKFDVPIEEAYKLILAGHELAV